MSITIYTADGRTKQFKIDKYLRKAVTEWLGYPAVKFYTTENGEDETNTFSPDDVVFAISYIPDKSLDNDIIKACEKGNIEEVENLISRCADVNATNEYMTTPIHSASYGGYDAVVALLLDQGADASAVDDTKWTPLHFAASNGYDSVIDILLKNGSDINAVNSIMDTPLHTASVCGYDIFVDILLKNGANVNTINDNDETPLYGASFQGNDSIVAMLLENGASYAIGEWH